MPHVRAVQSCTARYNPGMRRSVLPRAVAGLLAALAFAGCSGSSGTGFPFAADADGLPVPVFPPQAPSTPPPGVGNGQDGPLTVDSATVVNECAGIVSVSGTAVRAVSAPSFSPGQSVLLFQVQDEFATLGDGAAIDEAGAVSAGRWEIGRLAAVDGPDLTLEAAPAFDYVQDANRRPQICHVPEHTDVTISPLGSLVAQPWDGEKGGIVALFASGTLSIQGVVSASGAGFRGGAASTPGGTTAIFALGTPSDGGGAKGEGLDPMGWTRYGRGNVATGAGGGNASRAGGGGGGGGGAGGNGGRNAGFDEDTQGTGGAAVVLPVLDRLVMGGGGAGGHQISESGEMGGAGGPGGGVVLLFAGAVEGGGTVEARGADGAQGGSELVGNSADGAGGGGAGGTIVIRAADASTFPGAVLADGGDGGDVRNSGAGATVGPGGGGGGGRIHLENVTAAAQAVGGTAGVNADSGAGDNAWGATDGTNGVIE